MMKQRKMRIKSSDLSRYQSLRRARGFSLIEVMIALLVLAVGILGAGALQTIGLQTTQGAYLRSQAVIFAGDMVDRMRANRTQIASYAGVNTSSVTVTSIPTCWTDLAGCTPAQIVTSDVSRWASSLGSLPSGTGTITSNGGNTYTVTVNWSENEWIGATRGATTQTFSLVVSI